MKIRILSVLRRLRREWVRAWSAGVPSRKRLAWSPSAFEPLERREVLSTSTITPFVPVASGVTTAGTTAQVLLHFAPGQITSTKASTVLIGFYAEPAPGSTVTPQITEVDGITGSLLRVVAPKRGGLTSSKSLFFTYLNATATAAQDITVDVVEPPGQTGNFVLRTFLPGDANGDGSVDATDLSIVNTAADASLAHAGNNAAADFNADGHVGCIDQRLTIMNQGAHADYNATAPSATVTAAPPVQPTPVVTPAVATPVATAAVATPVVQVANTTPVVQTSSVILPTIQPTTVVTPVVPATPVTSATIQATIPTTQAPVWALVYPQPAGTIPVASNGTSATYAINPPTSTTTPVYYYGQPVVQAPGSTPPSPSTPAYYYNQPVVQAPTLGMTPSSSTVPVLYYSAPIGQPSPSTPLSYPGTPSGYIPATAPAPSMPVSYGLAAKS